MPISHFCDKARWALDRAGLEYIEERHLQVFHYLPVWRAGGGATVPVLVTEDELFGDSHDILEFAERHLPEHARLYPASQRDAARRLEAQYDAEFGVETRKLFYDHTVGASLPFFFEVNNQGAPRWQRALFEFGFGAAKAYGFRRLGITPASVERAFSNVSRALDEAAEQLADGRPYLLGDRFTAADLTFAALSSPVSMPPEYGVRLPPREDCPAKLVRLLERFDDHAAIAHARRMYREERHRVAGPAS